MTLSSAGSILGREPQNGQERAYVRRLAAQELADARKMQRSTGRYMLAALVTGTTLFAALTGVAFIIGASAGDPTIVTASGGPLQTITLLTAVFTVFQLIRAPFRSRRRARLAREYALVPAQALAQLADAEADDELAQ